MNQHIDHLAARSMAQERERDLQLRIRQDQAEAARGTVVTHRPHRGLLSTLHGILVRAHVLHAPTH